MSDAAQSRGFVGGSRMRVDRRTLIAAYAAVLLFASGCGGVVVGHWRLVKSTPNREVFAINDLTLGRDGAFSGTVTIDGRTAEETGRYYFNGYKIIFRPAAGGQREYNALLQLNQLKISDKDKRQVILERT